MTIVVFGAFLQGLPGGEPGTPRLVSGDNNVVIVGDGNNLDSEASGAPKGPTTQPSAEQFAPDPLDSFVSLSSSLEDTFWLSGKPESLPTPPLPVQSLYWCDEWQEWAAGQDYIPNRSYYIALTAPSDLVVTIVDVDIEIYSSSSVDQLTQITCGSVPSPPNCEYFAFLDLKLEKPFSLSGCSGEEGDTVRRDYTIPRDTFVVEAGHTENIAATFDGAPGFYSFGLLFTVVVNQKTEVLRVGSRSDPLSIVVPSLLSDSPYYMFDFGQCSWVPAPPANIGLDGWPTTQTC